MKTVLSIAGSDCSGGAGIQADIKTIAAHKLYAMTAITALTAQNTTGVYGISDISEEFLADQLDCIFTDIRPDAVKVGMASNAALIRVIAKKLTEYNAENIVVDPVMVSTSNSRLLQSDATEALTALLLPLATLITPNIYEAEILSGIGINTKRDMQEAAKIIAQKTNAAVLVKGGHLDDTADDLLYAKDEPLWICGKRIENPNTHGTGCTLSSAVACNLACGLSLAQSVKNAKEYLSGALKAMLDLGSGRGPLDHTYAIREHT